MASGDTLLTWLPRDGEPPASAYAQLDVRNGHPVLAFDTTTQEAVVFSGVMPRNYAGGGITVSVTSAAATATSGTIGWTIEFEADAAQDIDSDGFATAQTITAATVNATSGVPTTSSVAVAAGAAGTDSVAAGTPFRVRVKRDVANDTAAGDAQLLAVELKET